MHAMDSIDGSRSRNYQAEGRGNKTLFETIDESKFEDIEEQVTPRVLQQYENSLLISMKVSYELHKLADTKGPDAERFKRVANSVEEFTYRLLDPLNIKFKYQKG